jgi:glycerophosphoryl diester phosphodiesterase
MGVSFLLGIPVAAMCQAGDRPVAAWHRGDVSIAQENSRDAIAAALDSTTPNIEVDLIDFMDGEGGRGGLLAHDRTTDRLTGKKGVFKDFSRPSDIGENRSNPELPPAAFMTVPELFKLIEEKKNSGTTPLVSLDLKEEGPDEEAFGRWLGCMIRDYGFEEHVFVSSFYPDSIRGVKEACPECMVGGLVFNDHWALRYLSPNYTTLDLSPLSRATFFLGFLGKKKYPHDFVLIQDDILFGRPGLVDYWRNTRGVKFVGVFTYEKTRPYTAEEWTILQSADWLEIDPVQMRQYMELNISPKVKGVHQ